MADDNIQLLVSLKITSKSEGESLVSVLIPYLPTAFVVASNVFLGDQSGGTSTSLQDILVLQSHYDSSWSLILVQRKYISSKIILQFLSMSEYRHNLLVKQNAFKCERNN